MLPAPMHTPYDTTPTGDHPRLRLVGQPPLHTQNNPGADAGVTSLCTAHPAWSQSPDGTVRRLFPAGAGRAWLATWAGGKLDLTPINGAPMNSAPQTFYVSAASLPASAPTSLRRLGMVMHLGKPSLWDTLSTALMSQGPCPNGARARVRHWSEQFGEVHLAGSRALFLVPDPDTVLALPDEHFHTHGVPDWRVPLRAAATACQQNPGWNQLDAESLTRALTSLDGVDRRTALAAVAHHRADFSSYPLPHYLIPPGTITRSEHHALALFHLTAHGRTPGCTMTRSITPGPGRQSSGGPCLRAASAAGDTVARAVPGESVNPDARPGVHQQNLKVVIVGEEDVGKTTLVRSASSSTVVGTDEARSTPLEGMTLAPDAERPAGWGSTTTAIDFGRLTLADGTVLRLFGAPGAQRFQTIGEAVLAGADFAILLLDVDSLKASIPLLDLVEKHKVPVVVAVRRPSKGTMPPRYGIRSRLGLDDPMSLVLGVDPRDPHSARRLLADATHGLRQKAVRLTVLRLLASGLSDKEIASELGEPSVGVVRAHADGVCDILRTTSRIHAAARGVAWQLLTAEDFPHAPARLPELSDSDPELLSFVVAGVTDPGDLAVRLGCHHSDVRTDMERLMRQFNAASDSELAAHVVLLGAVSCRTVDERLPDATLPELLARMQESGGLR